MYRKRLAYLLKEVQQFMTSPFFMDLNTIRKKRVTMKNWHIFMVRKNW